MSIGTWLTGTLLVRDLTGPDGRWLYEYRLSQDEYDQLREQLTKVSRTSNSMSILIRARDFCGAFVLYASEWWRRDYAGGPWRWADILNSIGLHLSDVTASERNNAVQRGFAWWLLQPSQGGKRYFGSVVAHGGLPLNAIRHGSGANLANIMRTVLRQAARYQWDERQIAEAFSEYAHSLPASLREQEIYNLVAQMILAALDLKKTCGLDGASDPIALLDVTHPNWKNAFPIAIDDATVLSLLVNLVEEANKTELNEYTAPFVVERILVPLEDDNYALQSEVVFPRRVLADVLTTFAGLRTGEDLPGHLYVDAYVGQRTPLTIGRSTLGTETRTITFAPSRKYWRGESALNEHLIYLRGQTGDLPVSPIAIPGGQAMAADEPWIFSLRDERRLFTAVGNARLPDHAVLIAVKDEWLITAEPYSDVVPTLFGRLQNANIERILFRVEESVRITAGDQSWLVRTGQVTGLTTQFVLEGDRVPLDTRPWPLFRGLPRVVSYSDDGTRSTLPAHNYKAWHAGTNETFHRSTPAGLVDLTIMESDETIGRLRFGVIDKQSRETYTSDADPAQGWVTLTGWGELSLANDAACVKAVVFPLGDACEVNLMADGDPPSHIPIRLKWPGTRYEMRAGLPFPASGGRIYDEFNNLIPSGSTLNLARLAGKRIRVFDSNPNHPKSYEITLRLSSQTYGLSRSRASWAVQLTNGTGEVRLAEHYESIQNLFGFSDDLDAQVELTLLAGNQPVLTLRFAHYDTRLERSVLGLSLPLEFLQNLSVNHLMGVQADAISLSDPASPAIHLFQHESQGVPTGSWNISVLPPAGGPWLVCAAETSTVSFRPTVIANAVDDDQDSAQIVARQPTIANAIQHSDGEIRAEALIAAFDRMMADFGTPCWELLDQVWRTFSRLPLSSLDVYRQLARRPDHVVAMLFASQLPTKELFELVGRLQQELGLMLEIAPLSSWRNAAASFSSHWRNKLGDETANLVLPSVLENRLVELSSMMPNHRLILDMLLFEMTGIRTDYFDDIRQQSSSDPGHFGRILWSGEDSILMRYLLRMHAHDEIWPTTSFREKEVLSSFIKAISSKSFQTIQDNAHSLLWLAEGDFKESVANMPALCALSVACDVSLKWWSTSEQQHSLQAIKNFDPIWFDECYQKSLASCFAFQLLTPETTSHANTNIESARKYRVAADPGVPTACSKKSIS